MLAAPDTISFGRWRLDRQRRVLLAGGVPVALSGRAFDMLALLVERRGEVLSRDQIVAHVWRGLAVSDSNLTVQMSTLRRILGEHGSAGLVITVPGRGYRFVGEVEPPPVPAAPHMPPATAGARSSSVTMPREMPSFMSSLRRRRTALVSLALVFVACVVAGLTWRATPSAPRLSMAVLPFRNLSADRSQDYLVDALTDDLTTDLAHIPASTVIARESAAFWRDKPVPIQKIGTALGVRYLVEGSVRLDDDRFRVNAQLVDASTGAQMWSDRFDTPQGKMTEVRDAIVRHLASSLDFELAKIESARSLHDRPNDPDAVDLFFRARAIVDSDQSLAGLTNAQAKLEEALKQQPDFADAAAELGTIILMKIEDMVDPDETRDMIRADDVIAKALLLSPRNANALAARARELAAKSRWTDAVYSAKAALTLEPSNAAAYVVLSRCARAQGQLELAESYVEHVLRITPDSLTNKRRFLVLGYIRLLLGKSKQAIDAFQLAMAGDQESSASDVMGRVEVTHLLLVAATQMGGYADHARMLYKEYSDRWPYRTTWRFAAYYLHDESRLPGFQAILAALHEAGMPVFANEEDNGTASNAQCDSGDFVATPRRLAEGETWTTDKLASELRSRSPPVLIDIGQGAAVPPGGNWSDWNERPESSLDFANRVVNDHDRYIASVTVVVMGSGINDCQSYAVARALVEAHAELKVAWYRGGEEAWASRHLPYTDLRR